MSTESFACFLLFSVDNGITMKTKLDALKKFYRTDEALAEALGVTTRSISNYRNRTAPKRMEKLADFLLASHKESPPASPGDP